jgi:hypothetical protein
LKSLPFVSYTRIDIFGGRFSVRNERRQPLWIIAPSLRNNDILPEERHWGVLCSER